MITRDRGFEHRIRTTEILLSGGIVSTLAAAQGTAAVWLGPLSLPSLVVSLLMVAVMVLDRRPRMVEVIPAR